MRIREWESRERDWKEGWEWLVWGLVCFSVDEKCEIFFHDDCLSRGEKGDHVRIGENKGVRDLDPGFWAEIIPVPV